MCSAMTRVSHDVLTIWLSAFARRRHSYLSQQGILSCEIWFRNLARATPCVSSPSSSIVHTLLLGTSHLWHLHPLDSEPMPLHLPHLGHHRSNSHSSDKTPPPDSFVTPRSPRTTTREIPHRSGTQTSAMSTNTTSSDSTAPPSILRKVPTSHSSQSSQADMTGSSTSGSAYVTKKMNSLAFDRTDTISSTIDSDDEDVASTPATSVSSFSAQCPLPPSSATQKFPFFVLTLSSTSTLSFMALPVDMRPMVLDAVNRAWKKGIQKTGNVDYAPELMKRHQDKGCDGGVWEVTLKGTCWMPTSQEKVQ